MDPALKKIKSYIKGTSGRRMDDPVISEHPVPVPGLQHFSAYDSSWLVEDPLIPLDFYIYRNGKVSEHLPLDEIVYIPETEKKALEAGIWFLFQQYNYLDVKNEEIQYNEGNCIITITADYYFNHPMYGEEPHFALFKITCSEGSWHITPPDIQN